MNDPSNSTGANAAELYQRLERILAHQDDPGERSRTLKGMAAAADTMARAASETGLQAAGAGAAGLRELSALLERLAWAETGQVVIRVGRLTSDPAAAHPGLTGAWTELAAAATTGDMRGAILGMAALLGGCGLEAFTLDRFLDVLQACTRPDADPALEAYLAEAADQEGQ